MMTTKTTFWPTQVRVLYNALYYRFDVPTRRNSSHCSDRANGTEQTYCYCFPNHSAEVVHMLPLFRKGYTIFLWLKVLFSGKTNATFIENVPKQPFYLIDAHGLVVNKKRRIQVIDRRIYLRYDNNGVYFYRSKLELYKCKLRHLN